MGQMENSLLSIKNIFFLIVGNCVICYNNHGFIKEERIHSYINVIIQEDTFILALRKLLKEKECSGLSLYGMGRIGKLLVSLLDNEKNIPIFDLYDQNIKENFKGYPIQTIDKRQRYKKIRFNSGYSHR